jgi:hypothetical protein
MTPGTYHNTYQPETIIKGLTISLSAGQKTVLCKEEKRWKIKGGISRGLSTPIIKEPAPLRVLVEQAELRGFCPESSNRV